MLSKFSPDRAAVWQWAVLYLQAELAEAERNYPEARDYASRALQLIEKSRGADDSSAKKVRAMLQSIPSR
jgi:hypothetical protein